MDTFTEYSLAWRSGDVTFKQGYVEKQRNQIRRVVAVLKVAIYILDMWIMSNRL